MPADHLPPSWQAGVHPPGSEGFEGTAVTWLLDVVPPDYRLYGVLRRHPVALATITGTTWPRPYRGRARDTGWREPS